MKQAKNKTGNIAMVLFALCTLGLSVPTFAGIETGNPIELKFIGKEQSQPIFQLKLQNPENSLYLISIKDPAQNVLFSEKVKGIDIVRTYRMNIDSDDYESPSFGLTFEVTNLDTHVTQEYKVSSETKTHVTNSIIIAKL